MGKEKLNHRIRKRFSNFATDYFDRDGEVTVAVAAAATEVAAVATVRRLNSSCKLNYYRDDI
jgi:hypothetical protein